MRACGSGGDTNGRRPRRGRAGGRGRGAVALRRPPRALRRRHRRLPGPLRPTRGQADRTRPARALQPARLAPRDARRGPRPLLAGSPAAGVLRQIDRIALRRADLVVADTEQNARHLAELAGLPERAAGGLLRRRGGAPLPPGWQPPEEFHALFVGKLIPLHGARDDPRGGPPRARDPLSRRRQRPARRTSDERPPNVKWVDWVEYEQLPEENQRAGCALGVFGTSAKTGRVIPNKAFQALACGTPLVTADTPAARELLRRRRERAARPARRRRGAGGGRAPARGRRRSSRARSAPAGSTPTATRRARPCSAHAGSVSSSNSSPGEAASPPSSGLAAATFAASSARRRAQAPRFRERALRPREHDAGGLVDRPRRLPLGHRRPRRADLAARLALRPDPRPARAALVALARSRAAARRPGGRGRQRRAAGLLACAEAHRRPTFKLGARHSPWRTSSSRRCNG